MFIFDQLKKNDPKLRLLAVAIAAGFCILAVGLWWVQIVSARDYQANLQTQSFRTVRIPAVRGKILDQHGAVLAENQPTYNICLYMDELRSQFDADYDRRVTAARAASNALMQAEQARLNRSLTKQEKRRFSMKTSARNAIREVVRYTVASNLVHRVGEWLKQPLVLDPEDFFRHYRRSLAMPYTVLENLEPVQVARFQEHAGGVAGVDLEVQSSRVYPHGMTAAHLIGYLKFDDSSAEGEEAFFWYRLPDYRGLVGIEAGYDQELRGKAGAKSVLVNNVGYRQTENVWREAEPGCNVVLTIDLGLQKAVERALPVMGPSTRGAAVVMDVRTGDILAMASVPAWNPNHFVQGFPPGEMDRLNDETMRPQINRATQENYAPGSIFKTLVGLAVLEAGISPKEVVHVPPNPANPRRGIFYVGRRGIKDLAEPGDYNFRRALIRSSNTYFITNGLRTGIENILELARRFHLGERTGLPTRQEVSGILPGPARLEAGWSDGDTANICIGQGHLAVTPLQMTVMMAAIANGGAVLWPRLVDRIEPLEPVPGREATVFPAGRVRGQLGVKMEHLAVLHEAMLGDVHDPDGTGRAAAVPGMRICGKTGTAQVTNPKNEVIDQTTWFASFAPYGDPKYAVVVMVESGVFGGTTCAPVARKIYQALQQREQAAAATVARVEERHE